MYTYLCNQPAQCIKSCSLQLKSFAYIHIKMRCKNVISETQVPDRLVGVTLIPDHLGFSHFQFSVKKHLQPAADGNSQKSQKWLRQVQASRKVKNHSVQPWWAEKYFRIHTLRWKLVGLNKSVQLKTSIYSDSYFRQKKKHELHLFFDSAAAPVTAFSMPRAMWWLVPAVPTSLSRTITAGSFFCRRYTVLEIKWSYRILCKSLSVFTRFPLSTVCVLACDLMCAQAPYVCSHPLKIMLVLL